MAASLFSAFPKFTLFRERLYLCRMRSKNAPAGFSRQWRAASGSSTPSIFDDDSPVDLSEDNYSVRSTSTTPYHRQKPPKEPTPEAHKIHRQVMRDNFPDGWNPPRKLSREAMEGLRQLHHLDKAKFTTPVLAEKFRISPEAVRRILKSNWEQPKEKRVKHAEKDRQYMLLNRLRDKMRERKEIEEILQAKHGRTWGVDDKDKFTFE
ncbi:hypothetical protein BDP27DRAFT_1310293 [Rhodocollybia butyracea]|uniref:Required for respiratory growth protein 9, mitochondrial n=1 Tax=Rhodocollybia butyracea TaxID=206335 RepID=A0A9P5UG06_9AGAR|nr:hypothetical protein BDP27DRAFT_1310293 [Rhodocollybia butyracea]